MNSCAGLAEARGCPIRKSPDQSLFAAPRRLSQRITSFIASQCQGIHQMPLSRLIALIIDAHPGVSDLGKEIQRGAHDTKDLCFDLSAVGGQAPQPAARGLMQTNPFIHDVNQRYAHACRMAKLVWAARPDAGVCNGVGFKGWWSQTGSNRRPEACKATALPTELWPRQSNLTRTRLNAQSKMVGLGGLEPPTSRLSSARSNQLSYRPERPALHCAT